MSVVVNFVVLVSDQARAVTLVVGGGHGRLV